MTQTLKLSVLESHKMLSTDLDKAKTRIQELERKLAAQLKVNKDIADKSQQATENADQDLIKENASLKVELETIQQQRQIESLEALIGNDTEKQKLSEKLKTKAQENSELKKSLKALQAFDPERQKKSISSLKNKSAEQFSLIKDLNKKLKASAKELTELKSEAKQAQTDSLFVSKDKNWELFSSKFSFDGEDSSKINRIRALNRQSGTSYIAVSTDGDEAVWSEASSIPQEVSIAAGARIKNSKLNTALVTG